MRTSSSLDQDHKFKFEFYPLFSPKILAIILKLIYRRIFLALDFFYWTRNRVPPEEILNLKDQIKLANSRGIEPGTDPAIIESVSRILTYLPCVEILRRFLKAKQDLKIIQRQKFSDPELVERALEHYNQCVRIQVGGA
jgi:hypothetical protein